MSWLGGSISSLTGQLTNLTKDILTEGTEEISDHVTELQLAQEKIKSADTLNNAIKQENERLKRLTRELEENAESAELQINNISREYRILLEEKEKENKELKKKHHELLDFQAKSALSSSSSVTHNTSTPYISSGNHTGGFNEDELDIGDTISLQHEVNRLRQDVKRIHAECQHWRSVAGQLSGDHHGDSEQTNHTETLQLKSRIQELENQLIHGKEHHQHEVVSLQDVHQDKLSSLKRTHKQDVAKLEEKLVLLQEQSTVQDVSKEKKEENLSEINLLKDENKAMKMKINSLDKELEKLKIDVKDSQTEAEELQATIILLEEEKQVYEVEVIELRNIKEEASKLQSQPSAKDNILSLDNMVAEQLKKENIKLLERLISLEKTNEKFVVEKDLYEQRLKSYRRRLADKEDGDLVDDLDDEYEVDLGSELKAAEADKTSDDSNMPIDEQVRLLQNQVQQYQNDIERFEYVRSDWQLEKEALEDVLMQLREQLKQAESSLTVAEAKQGLEEVARHDRSPIVKEDSSETDEDTATNLASQINELVNGNQELEEERDQLLDKVESLENKLSLLEKERDSLNTSLNEHSSFTEDADKILEEKESRLTILQQEKDDLETSLDQLDVQHQEEQIQLINIKNDLAKKVENLKAQLKEKETIIADFNENLSSQDRTDKSELNKELKICQLEETIDKLSNELNVSTTKCAGFVNEVEDMKAKLQNGAIAVNDLHMEIRELEASLSKSKEELSNKIAKIMSCRDENNKLKEENQSLEDKIEDLEDEIEKWESINENNQVGLKLEADAIKLQAENEHLKQELRTAEEKFNAVVTRNTDIDGKVVELTKQIENIQIKNEAVARVDQAVLSSIEEETCLQVHSPSLHSTDLKTQFKTMTSEKQRVEKELDALEQKFSNQTIHYEKYLKDLEASRSMDESTLQQENHRLTHTVHEKENTISVVKSQLEEVEAELGETKETLNTTVDSQQNMVVILHETEDKMTLLRNNYAQLKVDCEEQHKKLQQQDVLLQSMQIVEQDVEQYKELIQNLQTDLVEAQNLTKQNSDAMDEKHNMTDKITKLDKVIKDQEMLIADHEKGISLLNKKTEEYRHELETKKENFEHHENSIAILRQNSSQKDEELNKIQRKLKRASSFLNDDQKASIEMEHRPDFSLPALEYHSKTNSAEVNGFENSDLDTDQIETVSKELDHIQGLLSDKDQIITDLQAKNSSLLKVLESKTKKSLSVDTSIVDVQRFENDVKKLVLEKEQIMAIMNEKSRESSTLKTEVHRLMNIVAAERTALNKLQKDNHELTQKRENPNEDMQKAALQQLSRLIRDRDLEIEALKQKNDTLLSVLQDSSTDNSNNKISTLLREKETLSQQFATLQDQNEQMIVFLKQKHQESVTYHNEVQRLSVIIGEESQKSETIKQQYSQLVPQFEVKKQSLLKLQDELITYKHRFGELEVKYGEMLQRSNSTDTVDMSSFKVQEDELHRFQEKFEELQKSIEEKDHRIQTLSQQRGELENEVVGKEADRSSFKKQVEHLQFQIQGLNSELGDLRSENTVLNQTQVQHDAELSLLKETNNKLNQCVREKEVEMGSIKEKCETLNHLMQDQRKDQGEGHQVHQGQVDRLVEQMDTLRQQTIVLQQEKHQALSVLQQRQEDNNHLIKEVERLREKEIKMTRELDRLRSHLIQIEEGYTREALDSEEREKELRNRVAISEEKLVSATCNVETASHQLNHQIEDLRYQLQVVSSQRDAAYSQVTGMQDQCQQYASSLANLQVVLEQFQQDKDSQIASESERYLEEIETLKKDYISVQSTLGETKNQLEEASEGLEAAARLSQQLDRKEEAVQALRDEVQLREKNLKLAEEEIRKLTSSTEAKVDKELMKNLLLGYFTTPQPKRKEVVHTIGGVLNFNPEEFDKISEADGASGGWVPGLFKFGRKPTGPTPPTTPVRGSTRAPSLNQSFSQLFVKFLERESSPPPPAVRLPAEKMAQELQQKHKEKESSKPPAFNPFTAPRHVAMPISFDGNQQSASDTHILMASANTPNFTPMFTTPVSNDNLSQPNSGRSTPQNSSSAILKDVLGTR